MQKVIMYNKNKPLLALEIDRINVYRILEVLNTSHLPIILQDNLDVESLNHWIEKRIIPDKRDGYEKTKRIFPNIANYKNMFSLSDQYWFRYEKKESWERLNFFTNPYSYAIGEAFFTPWDYDDGDLTSFSPDLTTNGVLKKVWKKENGKSYLYKAGSKMYHQEPLSEVLASITLARLDFIPFVTYELAVNGLELCSKCENFIDENTEFVPASYVYSKKPRPENKSIYEHLIDMCDYFGIEGAEEYMSNMIAADKIIGNDDRHLGNFGFIRDANTAEILGFAPLFDSGSAYWGKASHFKKSRLFSEREEESLIEALNKIQLGNVLNHKEMFKLINMYPKIGSAKRQEIKNRILNSERELQNLNLSIKKDPLKSLHEVKKHTSKKRDIEAR